MLVFVSSDRLVDDPVSKEGLCLIFFQDSRTGLVDGIIAFEFVAVKFARYVFKCPLGSMNGRCQGSCRIFSSIS
jgi:hypothetical protein